MNFFDYFTDPILRAPTWGTLLMCVSSALMGVVLFLRKKSLLGESLSHAAYPGIVFGVAFFAWLMPEREEWVFLAVLAGAFVSSLSGLFAIEWLEKRRGVRTDAALCAVLSLFFGAGIVAMSALQGSFPSWQRQIQMLLFGQAATMQDVHIYLYGFVALVVISFFYFMFRPLQALLFDRDYASSIGIRVGFLEKIIFFLLLLSLIVGIRSVGIVLVAGMAVAPAVAARQFSDKLKMILILSAIFGALSGLVGNILSVEISLRGTSVPTGPVIVLTGASIAILSLLFAPRRGWVCRLWRIAAFRLRCIEENILKGIWKKKSVSAAGLNKLAIYRLKRHGWIERKGESIELTFDGMKKAASVVRLHRLWELYLTQTLGCDIESVHRNAEEMEHVLTPDLEARLTAHLSNPKKDPHQQPIPERSEVL